MAVRRVVIDFDVMALRADQMEIVGGALSALERLAATDDSISLMTRDIKGQGTLRKHRSDKKRPEERTLQPQQVQILACLRQKKTPVPVTEISMSTGLGNESTRANLNILRQRGMTRQISDPTITGLRGGRIKLWQLV